MLIQTNIRESVAVLPGYRVIRGDLPTITQAGYRERAANGAVTGAASPSEVSGQAGSDGGMPSPQKHQHGDYALAGSVLRNVAAQLQTYISASCAAVS